MTKFDTMYAELIIKIMHNGHEHLTRAVDPKTGKQLKAKKIFGHTFEFDLREELPILTTKKVFANTARNEMIGFWVEGTNSIKRLHELGVKVWDEWEDKDPNSVWYGTIGPTYGHQLHYWKEWDPLEGYRIHNQVKDLIEGLKNDPYGRRHITTMWNVPDMKKAKLPPCAFQTIWDVEGEYLNLHLIQRSADLGLGVPFNVAQYAILVHMMAQVIGLKPGKFKHEMTNVHVYENHYEPLMKQLLNLPKDCKPEVIINPAVTDFFAFTPADIKIVNYESHPHIPMDVGV